MAEYKSDFEAWIQSPDARAAFNYMVRHGESLSGYHCYLDMQGSKRIYKYTCGTKQPFAFIVNRTDLLFYFRKAGLSNAAADLDLLKNRFKDVNRPRLGEVTVRILDEQDAKDLIQRIFGPWSVQEPPFSPQLELQELEAAFKAKVQSSLEDSTSKRQARLRNAPKQPEKLLALAQVFARNPDVVAEVLYRANGVCKICHKAAPFRRAKDGSPYLEVHHKIQLKDNGEDTVENAIAVCPNCHREAHFGEISG